MFWIFLIVNDKFSRPVLIFWQQYFVCDYAINVDCLSAEGFYSLNDNFGQVEAEERIDDSAFEEEEIRRK